MLVFDKDGNIVEVPEGSKYYNKTYRQPTQSKPPSMSASDVADGLVNTITNSTANAATEGLYAPAKKIISGVSPEAGKALGKIENTAAYLNPITAPIKIGQKLLGGFGSGLFGSGKSEDQQKRDKVRKSLQEYGFFGGDKDDWILDNPDGSGWDVGIDGSKLAQQTSVNTEKQGVAIGAVNPLAYLITGGDEKLATSFAGYFTNTITQGAGGSDPTVANANALDKYRKAGFDTPDKAHAGIDELVKAGKLDPEKAAAFHGGINTVFGLAPKATTGTSGTVSSSTQKKPSAKKKRRGDGRRTYEEQTYAPTKYAPQTTAPIGTSSPYGDGFAQELANIYMSNQGL